MTSLIIGKGEVGTALYKILSCYNTEENKYEAEIRDKENDSTYNSHFDLLHICFPYSTNFINDVKLYQEKYSPQYTIIHSTVPVGSSSQVGAIHSPIRGIHPNLEEGIRTFPKFIGGAKASFVADYFRKAGIKIILYDKSETTEALKLWDTQYYLENVRFVKRVKKYCDKFGLNFAEVFTIPNQTYNEGYTKLGMPEVVRPVLQPIMTEVGGHCLLPNEKLLNE